MKKKNNNNHVMVTIKKKKTVTAGISFDKVDMISRKFPFILD